MKNALRFTPETLKFIKRASKQKRPDWLDKNRADYEKHLLLPLQHLAQHLKMELLPLAPAYHFPQKGIGRLKRSKLKANEYGSYYKDWVSYSASRPTGSRFDHNPNLFFLLQVDEPDGDNVLVAGGLYMPSSKQLRAVREAIARDASAFEQLFASKAFASRFPGGFSKEKTATRPPRGFDPNHPQMDWLKLQAFFVWRSYKPREFQSAQFADLVANDFKQILRLNELLEKAIRGTLASSAKKPKSNSKSESLEDRLEGFEMPRREMDF